MKLRRGIRDGDPADERESLRTGYVNFPGAFVGIDTQVSIATNASLSRAIPMPPSDSYAHSGSGDADPSASPAALGRRTERWECWGLAEQREDLLRAVVVGRPAVRTWVVLVGLLLASVNFARAQPVRDHLQCYKIRDSAARAIYTADFGG